MEAIHSGTVKPTAGTDKLAILGSSTAPASSIESVYRHDVQANGQDVLTDVTSTASLTDTGTTITLTGLTDTTRQQVYTYSVLTDSRYNPGREVVTKVPLSCARHDYGAAASDWILSTDEANAGVLYWTNAGGAFNCIPPVGGGPYVVVNNSGQTGTLKKSGGTGATLANGKSGQFVYNGSDFVKISESV